MKKLRILGFICMALAICAVLLFTCTTEASAATVARGTCGSNLTWTLDDQGTLTISGNGAMYNWEWGRNSPWYSNCSSIKKIVMESGVTTIGDYAFYSCTNATSVTIPNGVTTIGEGAFCDCSGLISVTIPNGVTTIGRDAFDGCTSLTSITIPNSMTSIGIMAFHNCTNLTGIYISDLKAWCETYFGDNPLKYAKKLYLNNKLVSGDVVIPAGTKSIGGRAFQNCSDITSVTIPDSVTSIGYSSFYSCTGLTSVTILGDLTIINEYAFAYCSGLTSVTILGCVNFIGSYAFSECCYLKSMTIPNGVTTIGSCAFYFCSRLTSVVIPDSVTSISYSAFSDCYALKSITYCGTEEQWSNISIGSSNSYLTNASRKYHEWTPATCTAPETCIFCGKTEGTVEHQGGTWFEILSPTCAASGVKARICALCGTTETIELPAFGHSYSSIATQPTCTEQGYTTYSCSTCGHSYKDNYVSANGHSYTESVTQPTCVAEGTCVKVCSVCGDRFTEMIPTKGHSWSAWIQLSGATCTQEGSQLHFCNCGVQETEVIPMLPHSYVDGVCATCNGTMSGYVVLNADMNLTGLGLTEDLYVDLKGFDLSGTIITNGFKVYGMDSTTDGYTCESVGLFSCVDENGNAIVPVQQFKSNITGSVKRYMAIKAEDGYTFHRIYLAITKVNIRPDQTGFGYKAVFYGDEQVLNQLDSFGFKLQLEGQAKVLTQAMEASKLEMGREYSLLLQNFDVEAFGTTDVHAEVFLKLKDGTQIESSTVSYSMKSVLQKLCESLDVISDTQLQALKTMCLPFKATMSSWNIDALLNDE